MTALAPTPTVTRQNGTAYHRPAQPNDFYFWAKMKMYTSGGGLLLMEAGEVKKRFSVWIWSGWKRLIQTGFTKDYAIVMVYDLTSDDVHHLLGICP